MMIKKMQKKIILKKIGFLFFLLLVFTITACSNKTGDNIKSTYSIHDDLGNLITFEKVPKTVITLAPNLTEMIYQLGLGKKLIGNTIYGNYPPEAKKVTKVGDILSINYEKIVSLSPDIILMTVEGNSKSSYEKLKGLGEKIFVSNPRNYKGIKKTFLDIAEIFKITGRAQKKIAEWDNELNKIKKSFSKSKKRTAIFIVSLTPLMPAGKSTFLNEFMKFTGLKNIVADSNISYPIFSREEVLKLNPDFIICRKNKNNSVKFLTDVYPEWKDLKAVKFKHVIFVDPDLYFRPGPRFIKALSDLAVKIKKEESR